jgi:hypothetical protein
MILQFWQATSRQANGQIGSSIASQHRLGGLRAQITLGTAVRVRNMARQAWPLYGEEGRDADIRVL